MKAIRTFLHMIYLVFDPDDNIRLVVVSRNKEMFSKFINIIHKQNLVINRNIYNENLCIAIIKLKKHKHYLRMMREIQRNGLNLKMTDADGLVDELVEFKK